MPQNLTTLNNFKLWYNIAGVTGDDTLLAQMIAQASGNILAYLDRQSPFKNSYTEYLNGTGGSRLPLRQWPVLAVQSVSVDNLAIYAAVQPNAGFFLDPADDFPPGRIQYVSLIGASRTFAQGNRNCAITYTAGYSIQNEAQTIPSDEPYQITAAAPYGTWGQDDGVITATGTAFTEVANSPAQGQYSVADGVYNFNAADAGTAMLINYSYVPNVLEQCCREMVSERYAYRQRIGQKSNSVQGNTTVTFDNTGMTPFVMTTLQPYKRMVPF